VDTPDTFAVRLLRAQSRANLTQAQLAAAAGTCSSVIHHFQQGKFTPNFKTLIALAKALDVSTDYLCGLEDL
jgi:transcriptional regulator with XRE-family HTH domain